MSTIATLHMPPNAACDRSQMVLMDGRAAVASVGTGCGATTERGPPCLGRSRGVQYGGTRCGRVRKHSAHGNDRAWPSSWGGVHGHDGAWPSGWPYNTCAHNAHMIRHKTICFARGEMICFCTENAPFLPARTI